MRKSFGFRKRGMHIQPLYLSHWNDEDGIFVPIDVVAMLEDQHFMGIRFVYDCYRKKKRGCILNQEIEMNIPLQIAGFFRAIHNNSALKKPILVLCPRENVGEWGYYFKTCAKLSSICINETNVDDTLQSQTSPVIIAAFDYLTLMKTHNKNFDFFCVVIEELDQVANKVALRNLKGEFNIAVTYKNFFKERDSRLIWQMLNWITPGTFRKLKPFLCSDEDHFEEFRDPYEEFWQILTWSFSSGFKKPSVEELIMRKKTINEWSEKNEFIVSIPSFTKKTRKRNHKTEGLKRKTRRKKCKSSSEDENNTGNYENAAKEKRKVQENPVKEEITNVRGNSSGENFLGEENCTNKEDTIFEEISNKSPISSQSSHESGPLLSILNDTFNKTCEIKKITKEDIMSSLFNSPKHPQSCDEDCYDDSDILLSIMEKGSPFSEKTQSKEISITKEEIISSLFGDE